MVSLFQEEYQLWLKPDDHGDNKVYLLALDRLKNELLWLDLGPASPYQEQKLGLLRKSRTDLIMQLQVTNRDLRSEKNYETLVDLSTAELNSDWTTSSYPRSFEVKFKESDNRCWSGECFPSLILRTCMLFSRL